VDGPRPTRPRNLAAKLKDTANTSTPALSFQRKAVQDYHSRPTGVSQPAESTNNPLSTLDYCDDTASTPQAKRTFSSITENDVEDASAQPVQCIFFIQVCESEFFLNLLYHNL
jgi:hypothetical protein